MVLESPTLFAITSLALADAVNPCALAVLTMVLIAILTKNPGKKRVVLYAGLAFSLAVFVGYFLYGIILVQIFRTAAELIRNYASTAVDVLAVLSIVLGALNIKDYITYRRGGFATEMPLSYRPKVQKWVEKITSPLGAFFIGIFVTIFLLPCTIGPYVVASGILANLSWSQMSLWFVYYNFIFIIPMLAITFAIYASYATVDGVSRWRTLNIRTLHLIAGILMVGVGVALLLRII